MSVPRGQVLPPTYNIPIHSPVMIKHPDGTTQVVTSIYRSPTTTSTTKTTKRPSLTKRIVGSIKTLTKSSRGSQSGGAKPKPRPKTKAKATKKAK
jgi:hypothetical protein